MAADDSLMLTPDPELQRLIDSNKTAPNYAEHIIHLVQQNPSAARAKYKLYSCGEPIYPLYLLIQQRAPLDVIRTIYRAYPPAVHEVCTRQSRTTLHCACINRAPLNVVSLLLEDYPIAAMIQDGDGRTPLHYACFHCTKSWEIVELLLEKFPPAVKIQDNLGRLPLHWACMKCPPSGKVVSLLLEKYPAAVQVKDKNNGQTPLDILSQNSQKVPSDLYDEPKKMLTCVSSLLQKKNDDDKEDNKLTAIQIMKSFLEVEWLDAAQIMHYFIEIEWWGGVLLVFDLSPSIVLEHVKDLPVNVIPDLLTLTGHRCTITTLWNIVQNRQDVLNIS